jgi:arginine/lysine/ornithine decarboxylase
LKDQDSTPIATALKRYREARIVPFDVPGHKHGKGNPELTAFLGQTVMDVDVNSMKPLDNLIHPVSVIKEAETLAAEAFGASHCFFCVGGTTSAVQSMILSAVKSNEKIIMPRNVHRSAINSLILSGAIPVYVNPGVDDEYGIPLGMAFDDIKKAIDSNPDAKAVLVNNPTYYGICSDLSQIVEYAHSKNMAVLADEAHGTLFYFGANSNSMPTPAMAAGCDLAAVSMHKSGGSLTQSSFLLVGESFADKTGYVRSVINLTQTTSASYLLMSSLDISRRRLSLFGKQTVETVIKTADYARAEIAKIGGYRAFGKELINGGNVYALDPTKLSVNTTQIGLAGIEVYDLLRDEYDIQIEFGDMANFLCYISDGDRPRDIERLIAALAEIKRRYGRPEKASKLLKTEYIAPDVALTPQKAFYAATETLPLKSAAGRISGEFVMCYPPGIPILAPGERITPDIIDYIIYAKEKGCSLTGTQDMATENINVLRR